MSVDFLKMVGVSLSSSICTAVFVVACTAGAEKMGDDDRGSSDEVAEDDGDGGSGEGDDDGADSDGDGSDGPGDGGDDGDDVTAAELAELAGQIEDLVAFQVSALCFIGHMTDEQTWLPSRTDEPDYPGYWEDINWNTSSYGAWTWHEGPNSDSQKAYDDCF